MQHVLVTGAAGYIGSVLVRQLLHKGYRVRGLDILKFGGDSLIEVLDHPHFEFVKGDIRDKQDLVKALRNIDAVIHLAAIVGDPACAKEPDLARETNWIASTLLADLCQESRHIERFIFASTCSNYGKMHGDGYVTETSPLHPVSLYAELKVNFETYLYQSRKANRDFCSTALRFATVYGISPRMRFDLTVNEFVRDAALGREIVIYGEQFWRPYCHVVDLARSCLLVLESSPQLVSHNVFNVGNTAENYQKRMLAEEIAKVIPDVRVKYVSKTEDPRDYRVDFSKIETQLGFTITKRVADGIEEIYSIVQGGLLAEPDSARYRNT